MKITVCIGSSCHIKGSRQVVERLQNLIHENSLNSKVDLAGTFCMGKFHSVSPETVDEFFNDNVLAKVG